MTQIDSSITKAKDWVSGSESRITTKVRIEALLDAFCDVALGTKSSVDALPEDDALAAEVLSTRVARFLEFKLITTTGQEGREKATAFTLRGWRDICIKIITRNVIASRMSPTRRKALLYDGRDGLIPRLFQFAEHAVVYHDLHQWHKATVTWSKNKLYLLLQESEASFHMSQGIYNAEARIQFEALILMLAITGHRPSHFLVWAGSGGLLIDDLVVRQVAPAEYAIEGTLRWAKGLSTAAHNLQLQKFVIRSPSRAHNAIFDLPARIIAISLYRGHILDNTTGAPFDNAASSPRRRKLASCSKVTYVSFPLPAAGQQFAYPMNR